jgi:hypothetical protein
MNDPELTAITEITNALAELSEEQRRNVLLYINARYGTVRAPRTAMSSEESNGGEVREFATVGDLFDAADPETESDRVLVVGYWAQEVEGAVDFESYPLNKQLKQLGHPVSNITRALDSLAQQSPRLILQTSKSGNAKQARKRYKLTREGVKRIRAMLAPSVDNAGGE